MAWVLASTSLATGIAAGCGDNDVPPAGDGISATRFTLQIENVGTRFSFVRSGSFEIPVGAIAPGPIGPGQAYEVSFSAGRGMRLSFATMFVQSNDFFYAPASAGIPLFDDAGNAISGDITSQIVLWDAGTEADQEPGLGSDQAPRQVGPNTGALDPDSTVRLAADTFGNLPAVDDVIRVTLAAGERQSFVLRIENVSTEDTLVTSEQTSHAVPLSPGAWVVHEGDAPLFTAGAPLARNGLEAIAEDGVAAELAGVLASGSGITVPVSPGVFVVHRDRAPLFAPDQLDYGLGLEAIAEDGDPSVLAAVLRDRYGAGASGAFDTPVGAPGPAPIGPGSRYEVTFAAQPGDRLSLATMYVQSNDVLLATEAEGIPLFIDGVARTGDVSNLIGLWDLGTERNEEPGIGNDQAPRQLAPNVGAVEVLPVQSPAARNDGFVYAAPSASIRVTLSVPVP